MSLFNYLVVLQTCFYRERDRGTYFTGGGEGYSKLGEMRVLGVLEERLGVSLENDPTPNTASGCTSDLVLCSAPSPLH